MNILFKVPETPCPMAEVYCPVLAPCALCAQHFNERPWHKRALHFVRSWLAGKKARKH